ncbi:MAG: hypothetical protein ACK53T_00070 [Planctomycetota bacterium]|jgi:hypothetical protein
MSDLGDIFDTVVSEGGETSTDDVFPQNATIHMGDDDNPAEDGGDDTNYDFDESEVGDSDEDDAEDIEDDESGDESDDATVDGFDFDSVKDELVSVTVNGETFEVPLGELRNGYMRQADYTRKTQQIAADAEVVRWAKVLRDNITNNPVGVVTELASRLGFQVVEPNNPWNELVENDPSLAPLVQRLQQQEQELAELRNTSQSIAQDREQAAVRAELDAVKSKYPDFDPQVVLPIAIENGVRLEAAYKIWKADQLQAETVQAEAAKKAAAEAAARREKARAAKKKVSSGATKSRATEGDEWMKFDSFEDILTHELNR